MGASNNSNKHIILISAGIAGLTAAAAMLLRSKYDGDDLRLMPNALFDHFKWMLGAAASSAGGTSIAPTSKNSKHIVIVGAGISGLTAARELLENAAADDDDISVTIVEASDYVGGRIRANTDFLKGGNKLDIGAEIIHGKNTLLTKWCDEFVERGIWDLKDKLLYDQLFITAHADGGPDEDLTPDGKYGMYYIGGELLMYNDSRLDPLNKALQELDTIRDADPSLTVGEYLENKNLPPELVKLALASFANTAGTTNMHDLSVSVLANFEQHWEQNEDHGDYRLPYHIGMSGVVQAVHHLLKTDYPNNFEIKLNWPVTKIVQSDKSAVVQIQSSGETLSADAAIITVPPHQLPKLGMDLSNAKREALNYIGFENVVKVVVKFAKRLWPEKLHSIIAEDALIPELWFKVYQVEKEGKCEYEHVVICFLASGMADQLLEKIDGNDTKKAADIVISHLSDTLKIAKEDLIAPDAFIDANVYSWADHPYVQGGYMYPRKGCTMEHIQAMADPQGMCFFAGESTNTGACTTVQAAMETGIRVAKEVQSALKLG